MSPISPHNNFTLLRLVFALFVYVSHVVFLPSIPEMGWLKKYTPSMLGLQGFFVVSGFLVVMSYERSHGLKDYFVKRMRRILPAYVFAVVGFAVALVALSSLDPVSYFTSSGFWKYLGANLVFMNFLKPDLPGVFSQNMMNAVNGSLWTIKIELAFYVAVPVLMALARRFGTLPVFVTALLLSLTWRITFEQLHLATGQGIYKTLAFQAPGQFSFFICGATAYLLLKQGRAVPKLWMAALALLVYNLTPGPAYHVVAPVTVAIITTWAAFGLGSVDYASRYGDFSYGVYIYHWPLIQILTAVGLFAWDYRVGVLVCTVLTVALSMASWNHIERAFLRSRS